MTPATAYQLAPGEGDAVWFLGNLVTFKATAATTGGALTVAEFVHPAGFAPPLHRHLVEDEMFYLLAGAATFHCAGQEFPAGPGHFVLLPKGEPHTFLVGPDEPLRALQITTPGGFEDFVSAVGVPASQQRLPDPRAGAVDPALLGHAAALGNIEILGPLPTH